jgi:hypothetical protein
MRPLEGAWKPEIESALRSVTVPIHFDSKSRTFTAARTVLQGGRTTTAFSPVSNREGNLQVRNASFGASGYRGGGGSHAGGGSAGGSSRASGGASRVGGGSAGEARSGAVGGGSAAGSAVIAAGPRH